MKRSIIFILAILLTACARANDPIVDDYKISNLVYTYRSADQLTIHSVEVDLDKPAKGVEVGFVGGSLSKCASANGTHWTCRLGDVFTGGMSLRVVVTK